MLRVCVDTAPRIAQVKRVPEQRRARRFFEVLARAAQEDAVSVWVGLGERKDEDMRGKDALLLNA